MASEISSESTLYRRPRRGVAARSNSSESALPTSQIEPASASQKPLGPHACSPAQRRSNFLTLVRYIANTLYTLRVSYGFSSQPSLVVSVIEAQTLEFIGEGKTFYVSRVPLPVTVGLERSWPRKLVVLQSPEFSRGQCEWGSNVITCKRPLLEFDSHGNPKDGAAEERLKAVILEIKALTHPPLYFHKNIVDFLGVSWQCDLSDFEPGQTITGPPMRVPAILLEHAQHGSLADLRQKELYTNMPFEGRAGLCRDVAEGLAAMHRCGIVHGDMKLDNILIFDAHDRDGSRAGSGLRAKLADFGFSVGGVSRIYMGPDGPTWRSDDMLDGVARWRLAGRTWPWNDPEWNLPRTWNQLQKTDIFSYGLLVWTVLTGKEVWRLFDLDGENINRNDPELRAIVEELKDWTLSWNAASYFRGGERLVELLVECLFECSLDSRVEKRGTMEDILEIWNTWFIEDPPYQAVPPEASLNVRMGLDDGDRVQFQAIVRYMSDFPPFVQQQFNNVYFDPSISPLERFESTLFRAFAHLIGWGVERNIEEGKRLIDEAVEIPGELSANAALFQPMFFEPRVNTPGLRDFTEYEEKVLERLMALAHYSNSHEVFSQLQRYFPTPTKEFYAWLRSMIFRGRKYGIETWDPTFLLQEEVKAQLCAFQWADIKMNYWGGNVAKWGHNMLHFAVFSGFTEAIGDILESESFDARLLEERDNGGDTPLLAACRQGAFRIAELLIGGGASVIVRNYNGETTLHFLTEFENPEELAEISDLILALGGKEVIHAESIARTYGQDFIIVHPHMRGDPLCSAVMRGNVQLVKILLKHGANPLNKGSSDENPLQYAASGHFTELLRLFWEVCPEAMEWRNCRLVMSAISGFAGFQRMYFHGHLAQKMMESTFDFLLDKVISAGLPLEIGDCPLLYYLAKYGSVDIIEHIISRIGAAEINTYYKGKTPLHEVIQSGSNEKFKLLLKYGADPYLAVDLTALSPTSTLSFCCIHWGGTGQMVQSLIDYGLDMGGDGNFSALIGAVSINKFEAASALIDAGADIEMIGLDELTALGKAVQVCSYNSVAQLKFLLDHQVAIGKKPASFLVSPGKGTTALHVVATIPRKSPTYDRNTMSDVLDYLLDKFYSPEQLNSQDTHGYTALHLAASVGNGKVIQRLLDFEAIDLSIRSRYGMTAYEHAVNRFLGGISRDLQELGDRVVQRYKREMLEVMNHFGKKFGKEVDLVDLVDFSKCRLYDGLERKEYLLSLAKH